MPEVGLARVMANRTDEINRLDLEKLEFHQKVYNGYQELISDNPNKYTIVQNDNLEEAVETIFNIIKEEYDLANK